MIARQFVTSRLKRVSGNCGRLPGPDQWLMRRLVKPVGSAGRLFTLSTARSVRELGSGGTVTKSRQSLIRRCRKDLGSGGIVRCEQRSMSSSDRDVGSGGRVFSAGQWKSLSPVSEAGNGPRFKRPGQLPRSSLVKEFGLVHNSFCNFYQEDK